MGKRLSLGLCFLFFLIFLFSPTLFAASQKLEKQFEEAIQFFQVREDQKAEALFLKILEQDFTQIRPRQFLGLIYSRSDRFDEAIIMFEEIMALSPKHWGGPYGLGLVFQQKKSYSEAKASFKKAIALAPKNPKIWLSLSEIARIEKNQTDLFEANQMILKLSPKNSKSAQMAKAYFDQMGGDVSTARQVALFLDKAEAFVATGDFKNAISAYEEASSLVPEGSKIRYLIATTASLAGDLDRAESAFHEVILLSPNFIAGHFSLGKFYELLGKAEQAIDHYEMVLTLSHDETNAHVLSAKEALFLLLDREEAAEKAFEAKRLTDEQEFLKAEKAYKTALEIQPDNAVLYYQLANFYHQIDQNNLAEKVIQKARTIDADSKALYLLSGGVYLKQRYFLKAMGAYLKVMSLLSENQENILYRKAFSGNIEAAVLYLKARAEIRVPYLEGLRFQFRKKWDKALSQFLTAAALLPESSVLAYSVGLVYLDIGEKEQAYLYFKRSIDLYPSHFPARLQLARFAAQRGQFHTAITSYQRLLKLNKTRLEPLKLDPASLKQEFFAVILQWQQVRENSRRLFKQGVAAIAQGKYQDAIAILQRTREEEPENKSLLFSLGIAYAAGKNWGAAQKEFQELLDIDPAYPGALLRLAVIQEESGQLPQAKETYQKLLAQSLENPSDKKQAEAHLSKLNERIQQRRIASRHEKRGVMVLLEENPSSEMYEAALWELQRGVEINPEEATYYYNLGLVQEKSIFRKEGFTDEIAKNIWYDPNFLDRPIHSYETTLRLNPNYLQVYNRLARLYGALSQQQKAIEVYKRGLALGFNDDIQEIKDMKQGLAVLQRRWNASMNFVTTRDTNFIQNNQPLDDLLNSLSLNFGYTLYERPYWKVPLSYSQTTTTYFDAQTFSSSHGLGLGLEKKVMPGFTHSTNGFYRASLQEGVGLQSTSFSGSTSLRYRGKLPNSASIDYNYSSLKFEVRPDFDQTSQNIGASLSHNFLKTHTFTISHRYSVQDVPKLPVLSYKGYRTNLGLQRFLENGNTLRFSGMIFFQLFNDFPDIDNTEFSSLADRDAFIVNGGTLSTKFRKNFLYSYGVGLTIPWTKGVSLSFDYKFEKNQSNLGPDLGRSSSPNDIVANRARANGDYSRRLWTMGISFVF